MSGWNNGNFFVNNYPFASGIVWGTVNPYLGNSEENSEMEESDVDMSVDETMDDWSYIDSPVAELRDNPSNNTNLIFSNQTFSVPIISPVDSQFGDRVIYPLPQTETPLNPFLTNGPVVQMYDGQSSIPPNNQDMDEAEEVETDDQDFQLAISLQYLRTVSDGSDLEEGVINEENFVSTPRIEEEAASGREILSIMEVFTEGLENKKELFLPSEDEILTVQVDRSHLEYKFKVSKVPQVSGYFNFDDFMGIFKSVGVLEELNLLILDEEEEFSRQSFIDRFVDRIKPFFQSERGGFYSIHDEELENIRAILRELHVKISDELVNIHSLYGEDHRLAYGKFKTKIKNYFLDLGHAAFHCNDRIKQECELIFNEEFKHLGLHVGLITFKDKIHSYLRNLRDEMFKQIMVEFPLKNRGYESMDVATSAQHYQEILHNELSLSRSEGINLPSLVPVRLEMKIKEEFYRNYHGKCIVEYLQENVIYIDLYKWFEERFLPENLGENIFDESRGCISEGAIVCVLREIKVLC
jgi:hypothetical protein